MPDPETTPVPETPPVDTPETPPPPTPEATPQPVSHSHSPVMLELAGRYGITPGEASTLDATQLRQRVDEGQLLARDEAIRNLVHTKAAPTPVPETPFKLELPKELREQLEELNPSILAALEHVGGEAIKTATSKLQKQLEDVRSHSDGTAFANAVAAEMNKYPEVFGTNPVPGSKEAKKRAAAIDYLAAEERRTGKPLGVDAIGIVAVEIYGAKTAATPAVTPAPRPAPTPVARPTNRLNTSDDELNREELVEMWAQAQREADDNSRVATNGRANRP